MIPTVCKRRSGNDGKDDCFFTVRMAELQIWFSQETVSVARTVEPPFLDRDPDSFGYRQAILQGLVDRDDPN